MGGWFNAKDVISILCRLKRSELLVESLTRTNLSTIPTLPGEIVLSTRAAFCFCIYSVQCNRC